MKTVDPRVSKGAQISNGEWHLLDCCSVQPMPTTEYLPMGTDFQLHKGNQKKLDLTLISNCEATRVFTNKGM